MKGYKEFAEKLGRDILYKGGEGEDAGRVIGDFLGTDPF